MTEAARGRLEMPFLDGLRAFAALYVTVYHAYLFTGNRGDAREELPVLGWFIGYGFVGVPIFIVLSGFVLMLPILRQPNYELRGGAVTFIKRRARRILPPYYAALLLSLVLIFAVPVMNRPSDTEWDSKIPVTPLGVLSHIVLVHDFSQSWIYQINGPLWSVAVEWQIYFLMPLLLLPLWRRVNPWTVVAIVGIPTVAFGVFNKGAFVHPWYIALFASGMLAAQIAVNRPTWLRGAGLASAVSFSVGVAAFAALPNVFQVQGWASEMVAGLVTAIALAWLGGVAAAGRSNRVISTLTLRPLLWVGLFSYSLYLMHSPLLALGNLLLLPLGLPTGYQFLLMIVAVVPIAIAMCWGFFWLVERHFLNTHQRRAKRSLVQTTSSGHNVV